MKHSPPRSFAHGSEGMRGKFPGWTMIELIVSVAILSLILIPIVRFFQSSMRQSVQVTLSLDSQDALRNAMREIERDFRGIVQIDVTKKDFIEFRMDSHLLPGYNPNGDPDGDGIPNIQDADTDEDYGTIMPAADRWQVGFNVNDDDEFGPGMSDVVVSTDGKIDVLCRYYVEDGALVRDFNFHEAGWGGHKTVLVKSLAANGFRVEYFGNVTEPLGLQIDHGNDGLPGTADAGEGDRIITDREIDMALPAQGGNGNQSSLVIPFEKIDTPVERQYIFFLSVQVAQDKNGDGIEEFSLRTEIPPLLLPVRRSLP